MKDQHPYTKKKTGHHMIHAKKKNRLGKPKNRQAPNSESGEIFQNSADKALGTMVNFK